MTHRKKGTRSDSILSERSRLARMTAVCAGRLPQLDARHADANVSFGTATVSAQGRMLGSATTGALPR
jgi:hypothetical protein